jgi:hypothetical protein
MGLAGRASENQNRPKRISSPGGEDQGEGGRKTQISISQKFKLQNANCTIRPTQTDFGTAFVPTGQFNPPNLCNSCQKFSRHDLLSRFLTPLDGLVQNFDISVRTGTFRKITKWFCHINN